MMTNNSVPYQEKDLNSKFIKMIKRRVAESLREPGMSVTELCNKYEKHQEQLKMINK